MDENTIKNLREALNFSPNNIPLKQHLAYILLQANQLDEAEKEYSELIKLSSDLKSKMGLAQTFFQKEEYKKCNLILEEAIENGAENADIYILHAKALMKEHEINDAINAYSRALEINPACKDEVLDNTLRIRHVQSDDDFDQDDDNERFIEKPSINFGDVGGMGQIKKEIELKIIKPLLHPELYKAYGKKTGGGILLYGPPGCGKTYIAKATAGQVNAKFISVALDEILDMWIGNSEKNLHEIFEIARRNTPCVLFFDEIDALGASRSDMKQSAGRHLINQFLQELDGLDASNDGILILGATNAPWHLDAAFRRPGRFDRILFIPPPDETAREAILKLKLKNKPTDNNVDYAKLARMTEKFSGADIEALIDIAIEEKLESSFEEGIPKPLTTKDLLNAAKKHKPSTQEWFMTAKNFALFANESGLYDDILTYLHIKK